jgi:methyltransferase-like protein/SAM-dependent methyltransferase
MNTAYDSIPYKSYPFPQSHPNRLSTVGSLFGVSPENPAQSRVLELACASGGNLLPLAIQFPGTHLTGIDASVLQINEGQKTVGSLRLRNVRLLSQDIRELDESLGQFDYIIAHGLFSWVSAEVREKILDICRSHLAPQGIAYISYNAYPGWRFRGMIRDVMAYRARFFQTPEERLHEARSLVEFLAKSVPTENNAYGILLNEELKQLERKEDYYLLHEYLEDVNSPVYFHEFCEMAEKHGLQYLGEADYSVMSVNNFPPEVAAQLRQISSDIVQREQYMDFVRNRMFRQTLLCHKEVQLQRDPSPERLYPMSVASNAQPEHEIKNLRARERVTFKRPGSTLTTVEPLVKAAIVHLRKVWPRFVPFQELLAIARGMLEQGPVIVDADRAQRDARALAEPLLRCYATSHVDLALYPYEPNLSPGPKPCASPLARLQAETSNEVTNLWHESVRLNDLQRRIIRCLDGQTDREGVKASMQQAIIDGKLVVHEQGRPRTDPEQVSQILESILDENVRTIVARGLMMPNPDES